MKRKDGTPLKVMVPFILMVSIISICIGHLYAADVKPQYGGVLRVAEQTEGISIGYPAKMARIVFGIRQAAPALETLFRSDQQGKPVPYLVATVKENAKGKTITLVLKKGIKFHDGTDFNAEAVKWNLDECLASKTPGVEKVTEVAVVDPYTVKISLSEWDSTVISNFTQLPGLMISPTSCKKNGPQVCASTPVGTGPFQFVSWDKDKQTVYKKFPGYWQKGKPYIDGIEWISVAEPVTREMVFRKGDADLLLTVAPKDVATLEKDGYKVSRNKLPGAMSMVPDSANTQSPFADVRVRRAAQYAIDAAAIVKSIYFGEAEAANEWVYKGHWAYNASVQGFPYNPAKAKQLLTEAGYPNGFKTKIMYRTNPVQDQVFAAVQGYLKSVGIDAELEPIQIARYDQVAFQGGKWDGLIMNAVLSNPDVVALLAQSYAGKSKAYAQMTVPDDYAKAIEKAIAAPDFKTKQKWTQEVMKLMTDKYSLQITLLCRSDFAVGAKNVHDHGFSSTPDNGFWTPEKVWMEKK
jgi:peptide/nickel transport system substrate-binding protein